MSLNNFFKLTISLLIIFFYQTGANAALIINENTSSVINNVSVESNSGGQVYINGELIEEGQSNAQVEIYTEINGEVVEDISESAEGEDVFIEIKSNVKADDEKVEVKTTIINNKEGIIEKKEVIFNSDEEGESMELINSEFHDVVPTTEEEVEEKGEDTQLDKVEVKNVVPEPIKFFWQTFINAFKNIFSIFN